MSRLSAFLGATTSHLLFDLGFVLGPLRFGVLLLVFLPCQRDIALVRVPFVSLDRSLVVFVCHCVSPLIRGWPDRCL